MRITHLTYVQLNQHHDPHLWLKKLSFYTGILKAMTAYAQVSSIHCISYDGIVSVEDVDYHFIKAKKWEKWFPVRLNEYAKQLAPDIIIVHGLIFPWQVLMLRSQVGGHVKIIAQHHAERPFDDSRKLIQMWVDRYIDNYLFCSAEFGEEWIRRGLIKNKSKIKEVMEASSHFFPMDRMQAQAITKISGERIFLWVGRLDDNKDPLLLAKAFINFSSVYQGAQLYMIFQSFELLPELEALAKESKIKGAIHLVGKVEHNDLLYWYNSTDFIISSSHYEGSGIAVCEGLSCGCIPVLTDIPSFRMMTNHGAIGLLYEAGNVKALENALMKTTTMNIGLERDKVLNRFQAKLSFKAIARDIIDVVNLAS